LTAWIDSPAKLRKVHLWIVWTTLCLSFRGILRFRGYTEQIDQFSLFLGDENDFCLLMVILFPFVYLPLFGKYSKTTKLLCLAASFLCMIAIVVSDSRGGFIALVLVGIYCWVKSPRKVSSLILVGFLSAILLVTGGRQYRREIASIGTAAERGDTGRIRLVSWRAGWMVFLDNPLGVGGNNYRFSVDPYAGFFTSELDRSLSGRQAHSIYFTALPELGIFGLVVLPGLFISVIRRYRRTERKLRTIDTPEANRMRIFSLAGFGGLVGYFSAGAFVSVLYYPHAYYLAAFAVVVARLTDETIAPRSSEENPPSS
jgi:O-antigen ligase